MDTLTWALVIGWLAVGLALVSACATLYALIRPPRDTDVEELADEVAKLARRSRADTMRRVRAEAARNPPPELEDGKEVEVPPQLQANVIAARQAFDPRAAKAAARKRLLGNGGSHP